MKIEDFDILIARYLINKIKIKLTTRRSIRLLRNKISQLKMDGETAFHQGLYLNSFNHFVQALQLEKINPKNFSEVLESIDQLKTKISLAEYEINKEKINQVTLIIEKEDKLKNEKKFKEAYDEYQKAHKLIEEMVIFDGKKREKKVKDIFLKQIQILIEEGNELKSQNKNNKAVEILNKALDLAVRKLTSAERDQIINKIKKNLDTCLDIYSDKIREKIDLGNQLREQKKYEKSKQVLQIALNLIKEKYGSFSDSIANRFNKANEIREIYSLINQSESNIIKNNSKSKDIKSDSLRVAKEQPSLSSNPSIIPDDQTPPTKPLPMQVIKVPISTLTSNIKAEHITKGKKGEEKDEKPQDNTCNFCGNKLNKKARFCPQCGMRS